MANKKKNIEQPVSETSEASPKIVSSEDIDINELFARLKEFESKALLDRLKVIERNIIMIQKSLLLDRTMLKDIKQHVAYLSLAHEELLNHLGFTEYRETEETETQAAVPNEEKSTKKWN